MNPMSDLDRELSAALQVEPSPEFAARVRARVATEAPAGEWRMPGLAFVAMAGAALVAIAVSVWPSAPASVASRAPLLTARENAIVELPRPITQFSPRLEPIAPARSAAISNVIVSRSEMLALRRLLSGAITMPPAPQQVSDELSIPAISIDALPDLSGSSGERQ